MDESLLLTPDETVIQAQRLLDDGMPFHAHEVLEAAWKAAPQPERALWQGLAQLAVGLTHLLRGNSSGAHTVLLRGRHHVAPYAAEPPHGLDVAGVLVWTDDLLAGVPPRRLRLRRTPPA